MTVETAKRRLRIGEIHDTARRIAAIRSAESSILDALITFVRWHDRGSWDDIINSLLTTMQQVTDALDHEVGSLLQEGDDDIPC